MLDVSTNDTITSSVVSPPAQPRDITMAKTPDISELTTKQLRDLIDRAQSLVSERAAQEQQEGRAKVQAIANDLGISIYELMGVPKPEARQRKPAADGTRSPARAKYLLPNGEMWSGKGKIPHAIRAQLDGAEGYNPDGASFESKEARTNALKKFLIDQSDA